ncbi:RNA polymerase sigma factor [Evansella caseinilytica]|uniref:RNA polymerase sigma factor SigI n=1 Tax=Evansella caseinilytica TaxID=1503961 RepID=A0A1H3NJR2_9BACI|nr:RNA polymerase sigma-I factor [Evansella caseinilytica]SDY89166.1 RNA polymerase sigma factor [Evansella caseinilytica]
MLKRLLKKEEHYLSIEETIALIQKGDKDKENQFIKEYMPFIRKTTSTVCKRYIHAKQDDEFSIALIAFNEAIQQYSPDKGSSFLSFASLVIRRRIIDYIRQEQRRRVTLSMDYTEEYMENMENLAEVEASFKDYELSLEAEYRREEILHLKEQLTGYGITLTEVAEQSPKHTDARENMLEIAKVILAHDHFKTYLNEKKRLPIKKLTEKIDMSRKTIERNRKYIITLCIVLMEDYRYIQEYLKGWIS